MPVLNLPDHTETIEHRAALGDHAAACAAFIRAWEASQDDWHSPLVSRSLDHALGLGDCTRARVRAWRRK